MRRKQLCETPSPQSELRMVWVFSVYNAGGVAFNGSQNGSLNSNSTDGSIHAEERYCIISCSVHCILQQCQRLLLDVSCRLSEAMLWRRTFIHS